MQSNLSVDNTSRAACLARAEQVVKLLSTCYIREGWHESFDRDRAAQFIENLRTFDERMTAKIPRTLTRGPARFP
jgi:hypothetical protein